MASRKKPAVHDIDMEKALIGAIIYRADKVVPLVRNILTANDFYHGRHRLVWNAVMAMYDASEEIDAYTVATKIAPAAHTSPDADYLLELRALDFTIQFAPHYAECVRKCAIVRETGEGLVKLLNTMDHTMTGADEWLASVAIWKAATNEVVAGEAPVLDGMQLAITARQQYDNRTGVKRMESPYPIVNFTLNGGYAPGLHLVAARPGGGKSVILQETAYHWSLIQPLPVLFCSLEMDSSDVTRRMLAQYHGLDFVRLMTNDLSRDQYSEYLTALNELASLPLRVLYAGSLTVQRVVSEATIMARTTGLAGVVVDYIGLLQWSDKKRKWNSRMEQIAEMTHMLTALGNDLGVPVLVAVQMNRNVEGRASGVPLLSDLRECGDLEQDAYTVMFPTISAEKGKPGPAKFYIAKHRNGPSGDPDMYWDAQRVRFVSEPGEAKPGKKGAKNAKA